MAAICFNYAYQMRDPVVFRSVISVVSLDAYCLNINCVVIAYNVVTVS